MTCPGNGIGDQGVPPPRPVESRGLTRRRHFLNWLLGSGAGALAVSIFYPIVRYLVPPEVEESVTNQVTLPISGRDVPPNSGQIFRFGSRPGILIRAPSGELRAFDGQCTHLDCIVQYREDLEHIWCACHNGHYDLHGVNIEGPPPRPLPEFSVVEQEGKIVVSKEA